jgi:DNA-binding NtrC family response regulator
MLLAEGPSLSPDDFGIGAAAGEASMAGSPAPTDSPPSPGIKGAARAAAAAAERRMIRAAMDSTGGNVTRAAARLGLSRRGLQLKLKELGLRPGS